MQGQEFILDISQISNVRYPTFVSLCVKTENFRIENLRDSPTLASYQTFLGK